MAFDGHLTEFPRNLCDFQSYRKARALGDPQISYEIVGIPVIPRSVLPRNFHDFDAHCRISLEIQARSVNNEPISEEFVGIPAMWRNTRVGGYTNFLGNYGI